MRIEKMIAAVQRSLGVSADGRAGPQTWGAIYPALIKKKIDGQPPAHALDAVDTRNETTITTLLPQVRLIARALERKAAASGIRIKIISSLRTYAEQDALYAQGRTKPGKVVTSARGGHSNRNLGIASDIGVFVGNAYLGDGSQYKAVGALGLDIGLEWGGNWKNFTDQPHYQLRPLWAVGMRERDTLAELRRRKEEGRGAYDA